MFRFAALLAVAATLSLVSLIQAEEKPDPKVGTRNKEIKIGDQAPSFSSLKGVDGKSLSLDDLKDKDVVVLCVTCNHCPVAVAYEDRMIEFAKKHAGPSSKVGFIAVNCNVTDENADSADNLPKMVERAKEKGFNFPYLIDTTQGLGRKLGASVTPEFFVLNKERKIVYMGAMDNHMGKPTVNYLEPAVKAALAGETPKITATIPHGCSIKYTAK